MYEMLLKQYMRNLDKLNTDIDNCYSLFIGQYSPATEQALTDAKNFKSIQELYNSIGQLKLLEKICYNYQSYKFALVRG